MERAAQQIMWTKILADILGVVSWLVNHKRVERIWRREGLKVPQKQPKTRRLWLNDGSSIRKRPQYRYHVWDYDFVMDRTDDGKRFRMLTVLDESWRACLHIKVVRKLNPTDIIDTLVDLFILKGVLDYIRSDNGSEFTAHLVRNWLGKLKVKALFIEPGSPWENGYNESLISILLTCFSTVIIGSVSKIIDFLFFSL